MKAPSRLPETPSQTAGPFVHIGLLPQVAGLETPFSLGGEVAGPAVGGLRIRIEGVVRDGLGAPVRDAVLEAWQADGAGVFAHPADPRHASVAPGFRGFARAAADPETGAFGFQTIKPGPVGAMAPHIALWIVARGINRGLATRLYFADEGERNAACPVLGRIDPPERRETLLARPLGDGAYRFEIRLQGQGETVFFDV
ncbi:MAG: protocatechuate 3,4-dioxygenase subunit alpha [Paracoccaceae bacterium]